MTIERTTFSGDAFKSFLSSFIETHVRANQTGLVRDLISAGIEDLEDQGIENIYKALETAHPALTHVDLEFCLASDAATQAARYQDRQLYNAVRKLCYNSDDYVDPLELAEELGITSAWDSKSYSYFLVSSDLATDLEAMGAELYTYGGSTWWATQATPQESALIKQLAAKACGFELEPQEEIQLELPFIAFKAPSVKLNAIAEADFIEYRPPVRF
jgi:hypothetical protein